MRGVVLPGDSTGRARQRDRCPSPGQGQVLLAMKASSICGSDIRAIYREHLGHGPEAYQGVIAGHEPCGQVVAVGPGLQAARRRATGSSSTTSSGCGVCDECRTRLPRSAAPTRRARRTAGSATAATRTTCWPRRAPAWCCPTRCRTSTARWSRAASARPTRRCCGSTSPAATACWSPGSDRSGWPRRCSARALGAGPVVGTDVSPERLRARRLDLGPGRRTRCRPIDGARRPVA